VSFRSPSTSPSTSPLTAPLTLSLIAMAGANVAANRLPGASVAVGLGLTGVLGVIARTGGLSAADVGLARSTWGAGLRWGGASAAVVAAGYGVALLIPAARDAVAGSAAGSWPSTLAASLVVIPLATVVPEEFAFRGVLWGLLRRRSGPRVATAVSSALFGVWHVLPALSGGAANEAVDGVVGGGTAGAVLRVLGTIVFTGAAGVLLCELRARTGSLLAPIMLHWAVNGLGEIFVKLA